MAEPSDRRQQNQAFLQELEKQRLNKDCLRIIDLRGKVVGECQAYEFGGRIHYLDDRGYLLVKQLLNRFNGRYTIGVYEAFYKALKQLDSVASTVTESQARRPEFLHLDKFIERAEARIVYSTPVQLRIEDMLYHGHTVDMAINAIRISLRRSYSLHLGDRVAITFLEFEQQDGSLPFDQVYYQIIKLEHDAHYTTAVLRRDQDNGDAFVDWLGHWLDTHASDRPRDSDNELINLQTGFYQRLWLRKLAAPLLWLGEADSPDPLIALHLALPARDRFDGAQAKAATNWLGKLPLLSLTEEAGTLITAFDSQHSFTVPLTETATANKLINWYLAQADSCLLLLDLRTVNVDKALEKATSSAINDVDTEQARLFQQRCKQLRYRVAITDLSPAMQHLTPNDIITAAQLKNEDTLTGFITSSAVEPESLDTYIHRHKARYYIHTPVTVHLDDGQQWSVTTLDVSADGLAIRLPGEVKMALNQRLHIDFDRWQTMTDKVRLSHIPYQVKNTLYWQGSLRLGLQRIKSSCPESLNQFFDWVIHLNQEKLTANQDDQIKMAENRFYSQTLLPTLNRLPLFLGFDSQGQRHIQLVGVTDSNAASNYQGLWQALEAAQLRLGEQLKRLVNTQQDICQTTLYAYADREDQWTLAFEDDFLLPHDKALFIQRGLSAPQFKVFSADLTVIKSQDIEQQEDLMTGLMQWRQQRAHRVSTIRQQLSHLLGLLELTDITAVISAFYQP